MKRDEVIRALELGSVIFTDFIRAIPEKTIMARRRDFWTIYEHIEHLAAAQVALSRRIENFIKEDKPVIKPFNPDEKSHNGTTRSVDELLGTFSKWRAMQVAMLKECPEEVWNKSAEHPEYSSYTFYTMVRHILLHDGEHMYRIEELWLLKDEYIKPL
jgi:hypothetical protein